ncbi:MAG TPA: hypothetical protein VJM51_08345 [Dehalococcoidia bacterium]|nr:hypothetical protein [Dehalococcoidia bacterium]
MIDELDSAAQALGAAHAAGGDAAAVRQAQYSIRCAFCNHLHESDFWEEVESGIMLCRDAAPGWRRGDLEHYSSAEASLEAGP